ncbi:hypothetical protein C2845_PM03G24750 [Panicum miliaceum]|uniref:Uncharacterized protein n=1 Tax=Panicum miliaceum TaxID=4540 RepID=A0A3L6T6A9_PANMI|nr:hypothetical protein C2845_PM03G24750 [Panicum miliaceum]
MPDPSVARSPAPPWSSATHLSMTTVYHPHLSTVTNACRQICRRRLRSSRHTHLPPLEIQPTPAPARARPCSRSGVVALLTSAARA